MSDFDFDAMLRDREAGTPGQWAWRRWVVTSAPGEPQTLVEIPDRGEATADVRRWTRVPDMEAEIIALRAAVADVVATAKPIPNLPGWTSVPKRAIDNARRLLREDGG
jgi:hypothetical protein